MQPQKQQKDGKSALLAVTALAALSGASIPWPRTSQRHMAKMGGTRQPAIIPPYNGPRGPVGGSDRNAPCECGCGRKRKKCPNGHISIPPSAHGDMAKDSYTAMVYGSLLGRHGISRADAEQYLVSHIESYWGDGVITIDRCADLVAEMIAYDQGRHD